MRFVLFSFIVFLLGNVLNAQPSEISINVQGAGFEKRDFANGALAFTNRSYVLENIPTDFAGFEFLASEGKVANEGTITPLDDGFVYVIAPTGGVEGWTLVENTIFNYTDGGKTELTIYQHAVTANTPIEIPSVTAFPGASPLAKNIQYKESSNYVKGDLIDIRLANEGNDVFPQNTTFKFQTLPASVVGKKYATSLVDYNGVEQVSADTETEIVVATHYNTVDKAGWVYSGDYFSISSVRKYYIYTYQYTTPGQWIDIPQPKSSGTTAPTLVFGDNLIWSNPQTVPGVVITKSLDIKGVRITNPGMTILPDGDYLAACTGALRYSSGTSGVSFFLSKDKGLTWQVQSANNGLMSYQNLFVHNGQLYVMGTNAPSGDIIIRKSLDKGITWTYPTAEGEDGWIKTGSFHSAPVPVVVHNGRIWRAFEYYNGGNQLAFVMSAPVDSDLMKASSWSYTTSLGSQSDWIPGKNIIRWIEGNAVVDRNGKVVNILKLDERSEGGIAAITTVTDDNNLAFDPSKDIISFPGGCKKFTIRYDAVSDKYWTLTNACFEEDRNKTHAGIYKDGVHSGLLRNRVVLMYSNDLRNWTIKDTVISSENPFFHGFQYLDWQIEGDDLVAVSRTAFECEEGLPVRQHDANFFTFHRIENFRDGIVTSAINLKKESAKIIKSYNRKIEITGKEINVFDISIYDLTGRIKYVKANSTDKVISTNSWIPGIYFVRVTSNGKLYIEKIFIHN